LEKNCHKKIALLGRKKKVFLGKVFKVGASAFILFLRTGIKALLAPKKFQMPQGLSFPSKEGLF